MSGRIKKGESLLWGVFVLSLASLSVKIIGLCFKIPLSHLLGDEGMGYFNSAYTIYGWLYVIATAGLPLALSILVSGASEKGDEHRVRATLRVAMTVLFSVGFVGSLFMLLLSGGLARIIGSRGSRAAIFAIAPTLLFVSVSGGIRGYFQGRRQMLPTALSQLIEAAGKLFLGILFCRVAVDRGASVQITAAYSILGVTVGTLLGTLYLIILLFIDLRKRRRIMRPSFAYAKRGELGELLSIALPITLSASVSGLTNLIDLTFIMNLLPRAGYGIREATAIFGNYSTLVVPISHAPLVLISPVTSSLVPYLTAELARQDLRKAGELSSSALRFVSILTLPAMTLLSLFGEPILSIVFDPTSSAVAAPILAAISPSIFFFGLCSVTNAILEASGRCTATLRSMSIGAAVKIAIGFLLIGNPRFGIYGAVLGSVGGYATSATLNLLEIKRRLGCLPSMTDFFAKPFAAASVSAFLSVLAAGAMKERGIGSMETVVILTLALFSYVVLLPLFRAISKADLVHLPLFSKWLAPKLKKK